MITLSSGRAEVFSCLQLKKNKDTIITVLYLHKTQGVDQNYYF